MYSTVGRAYGVIEDRGGMIASPEKHRCCIQAEGVLEGCQIGTEIQGSSVVEWQHPEPERSRFAVGRSLP